MPEQRILLSGGGSGGSVTPLLAVANFLQEHHPTITISFVGTRRGPERGLVAASQIEFHALSAAKFRRYFSWKNIADIGVLVYACFEAWKLLRILKPSVIVSAGGYVSVPVVWVGWLMRIPSLIHQQDIHVGLANRLMVPFARTITVSFEDTAKKFPAKKVVVTGNPFRSAMLTGNAAAAQKHFHLDPALPTLLVLGGGTGAQQLNNLVTQSLPMYGQRLNVIHVTGRGKGMQQQNAHYYAAEFLTEDMGDAFAAASLVVSRAGLGTLTELAALGKPTILIPMPNSHQEVNAHYVAEHNAAIVLDERSLTPAALAKTILETISDSGQLTTLGTAIRALARPDATQHVGHAILHLLSA